MNFFFFFFLPDLLYPFGFMRSVVVIPRVPPELGATHNNAAQGSL